MAAGMDEKFPGVLRLYLAPAMRSRGAAQDDRGKEFAELEHPLCADIQRRHENRRNLLIEKRLAKFCQPSQAQRRRFSEAVGQDEMLSVVSSGD